MTKKLEGKVAVVTGASKGIGAGIAKALADEGAAVVVNYSSSQQGADRGYIIVHGRIEFEGRSTQELRENELVKKYYLGV